MKKILNALFLTLLAVFTFSSCSDVPAPYDILGEGDIPGLTGDGTKENPYNIETAQKKQDASIAWVQGYIVGSSEGASLGDGAKFEAPFVGESNILIADDVNEKDYKKCIPVQLVAGTELRSKLNLVSNAGNHGKIVIIKGSLEKYYSQPGMKSPTAAVLDNVEIGEGGGGEDLDPDNPLGLDDSNPVNSFSATFDDAVNNQNYVLENWYNVAVAGGRSWQGKIFNTTDKYIQATSYNGTGSNFECWFVTPAFKVDEIADKTVSFKCAVYNYATAAANSNLEVYFLKLVNGKMQSEKLTITGMPTTDNTWVSLEAKLDQYPGQTGFVGFKYTSTSNTEALSYRLDDIQAGKGQGGGETPGTDPVGDGTKDNPYDVATALSLSSASGTDVAWVKGYIVGSVKNGNDANTVDSPEDVVFGLVDIRSSAIVVADSKDETDYTKCLVIGFGNDSQAAKTALNLVNNPDKLGAQVLLYGTLKYAFNATGMKTITDHELVGGGEVPEPSTGEIFITEYVEGSSNNKYIEIYNPTGQTIDLAGYSLDVAANGGDWSANGTYNNSMDLTGKTIASRATLVFKHKQATIYAGEAIEANFVNFNGDDAVGLFKNGVLIDIVGKQGDKTKYGENVTLRRKSSVTGPNLVYTVDEWDTLKIDDISGLGSHTMN